MSRETVGLRAVIKLKDGREVVQTGIYVFSDTTINQIRELMKKGINIKGISCPVQVSYVEIDMEDEEEEE